MALTMSVYMTLGLFLFGFIAFFRYYRKTFSKLKGIPLYHSPLLYLDYLQKSGTKYVSFTNFVLEIVKEKCIESMKDGLWMTYITGPIVMVFGEEPVKILSIEKEAATKPERLYRPYEDRIGSGIITENGEKWRKHRKLLNGVFSHGLLKDKVALFNEHALALIKDLETLVNKPSVDLLYFIKTHYFNALSESVFGMKQTEENKADALKYFHNMDTLGAETIYRATRPWLHWKFMLRTSSYGRQILHEYEDTVKFTKNAILKMKEHISSHQTTGAECFSKDMRNSLTYLLLQHQRDDPSFAFKEVHGQASNFMSAGYSTVSYATLWCLFMLGLNPDVQEKAYNEVQFISTEDNISFDDSASFKYLESVILETLRLYPTIPIFIRQLTQDVQCGKHTLPNGTVLGFVPYAIHRNPDVYPDPEKFDPERFLGTNQINSWNYIPFAEGYRNCLGKKYALIEMKIFLAHFLRKFKVTSLDRREDIALCWNVVLAPAKPLRMRIERRCSD